MKKVIFILLCAYCFSAKAQQKIRFDYDAAGNQIVREWCINCTARNSTPPKNSAELNDNDLVKFDPGDAISYYPNPVKEELFLKWELINNVKISEISIYNANSILVKKTERLNDVNSCSLAFSQYPQGIYFIELKYTTGEIKSIKIIKQ